MIRIPGFDFQRGLGIFLFTTVSTPALKPTQPPIQWVSRALSLGVMQPGREADHSSPSTAKVKEFVELYSTYSKRLRVVILRKTRTGTTLPYIIMGHKIKCGTMTRTGR